MVVRVGLDDLAEDQRHGDADHRGQADEDGGGPHRAELDPLTADGGPQIASEG
jgi:hypothetical protein